MLELDRVLQTRCAHHLDVAALGVCSRCGDGACAACWSSEHELCVACATRDPLYGVAPLPWEDGTAKLWTRVFGTWWSLLKPASRARALARGGIWPALTFWSCISLPLACLATVIPLTRTLLFLPPFRVELIGTPGPSDVLWDVLRALAYGAFINVVFVAWMSMSVWFAALFRSARIWFRTVLYWSWLPPVLMLSLYVPAWAAAVLGFVTFACWPLAVVWWVAQWYVARRAAQFGWLRTFLTVCSASAAAFVGLGLTVGMLEALGPAHLP